VDPEGSWPFQRQAIFRTVLVSALAVAGGLYIVSRMTRLDARQFMVFVPVLLLLMGVSLIRTMKRERAAYFATEWDLGDDLIRRRMPHRPDIEIRKTEVKKIEQRSGGLLVRGAAAGQAIWIPGSVKGFSELSSRLSNWQTIERPNRRVPWPLISALVSVGSIATFVLVFVSHNPWLVVPLGLCFSAFLLWCTWYVRRSPHLDERIKKTAWFFLMPVVALLGRVVILLASK
jgi:hypothetical protein